MKTNKKCILGIAFMVVLSMGTMLYAGDIIQFDPDGTGPMPAVSAITFDWSPGNAQAIKANPEVGPAIGDIYPILYQANLGSVKVGSSTEFQQGANGNYITSVASYKETVSFIYFDQNGKAAGLGFGPVIDNNSFFKIYHNTTGNAVDLADTPAVAAEFVSGDLILSAHLIAENYTSQYFSTLPVTTGKLDQNGIDNWAGQLTQYGSGSTSLEMYVDFADSNYFPDLLVGSIYALGVYNTNQKLPFDEVDPSKYFFDGTKAVGNLGLINGGTIPHPTEDILFQSDANGSFTRARVPEPTTLLLLGSGLLGLAVLRKRA